MTKSKLNLSFKTLPTSNSSAVYFSTLYTDRKNVLAKQMISDQ